MEFFTVKKVPGGFAVIDFNGQPVVGYRDKATTEKVATSHTHGLFTGAETYDARFVAARRYLAARAQRAPVNANQLELF